MSAPAAPSEEVRNTSASQPPPSSILNRVQALLQVHVVESEALICRQIAQQGPWLAVTMQSWGAQRVGLRSHCRPWCALLQDAQEQQHVPGTPLHVARDYEDGNDDAELALAVCPASLHRFPGQAFHETSSMLCESSLRMNKVAWGDLLASDAEIVELTRILPCTGSRSG